MVLELILLSKVLELMKHRILKVGKGRGVSIIHVLRHHIQSLVGRRIKVTTCELWMVHSCLFAAFMFLEFFYLSFFDFSEIFDPIFFNSSENVF